MVTATVQSTGSEDTALIQEAINDLTTSGGTVYLSGKFLASNVDATKRRGLTICGDGPWATEITPISNSNSIFDLSGSFGITLRGMKIGDVNQAVTPGCAILTLQTKNNVGNWLRFHDLYVDGKYMVASWYNYGFASSYVSGCAFWNYRNVTNQRTFAVYMGSDNFDNFASPYLPTDGSGYSVATGGNQELIDWQFDGCELHAMVAGGGFGNSAPLRLRGAKMIGFNGGNMSGSGYALVTMESDSTGRETYAPSFHKVDFYAEIGPLPQYIFDPTAHVDRLESRHCYEQFGINLVTHPELLTNFDHI